MSKEIKEILNAFKEILDNPTTTDECYDGRIIEIDRSYDLDLDEIKALLDYITNLQEENNNLKEDFKRHIDRINELTERSDNLQEENKRLRKELELCKKNGNL